jgi:hypothetical protein
MLKRRAHGRKPRGKPTPEKMALVKATKSAMCVEVQHDVFHQMNQNGLFICTIGSARTHAKLTKANLA